MSSLQPTKAEKPWHASPNQTPEEEELDVFSLDWVTALTEEVAGAGGESPEHRSEVSEFFFFFFLLFIFSFFFFLLFIFFFFFFFFFFLYEIDILHLSPLIPTMQLLML